MIPASRSSSAALAFVIVEDDYQQQQLLYNRLRVQFPSASFERISTEWEFTRRYAEIVAASPSVVVLDLRLRWREPDDIDAPPPPGPVDQAGQRLLERLASEPAMKDVPIVVASSIVSDKKREDIERRFAGVYFAQRENLASMLGLIGSLVAALPFASAEAQRGASSRRVRNRVFISHSSEDDKWADDVRQALEPYRLNGTIELWDDSDLEPGKWDKQIEAQMQTAGVALFLMSPHFCTSEFILNRELRTFLDAHATDGLQILWILVSACAVETTPLAEFQCLHNKKKPLDTLTKPERNVVLTAIAKKIAHLVQE